MKQSCISRTVWHRIAKFYTYTHTGLAYNHTEYDITGYFRSEVITTKLPKMPPPTFYTAFCWAPSIGGHLVKLADNRVIIGLFAIIVP